MAIAVDIPNRRIAISSKLDATGGNLVWKALMNFIWRQRLMWPLPAPARIEIGSFSLGRGIKTQLHFKEINGWKIESMWNLDHLERLALIS